jgi:CheY-like chemotaxis protein
VEADATQLHQVLLNLCVNARDAMPNGGSLCISAENVLLDAQYAAMNIEAREGPHVRIDVADSGTGIAPAIIDKIFDPFFTTKEVGKGTGLGLSTTLAIVKSHGGFIRAYSDVGVGTRMRVYLPAMTAATAARNQDMTAALPRGNGETVMVVDDEASIRQITRQTLEAFGYSVILAADGSEAVSIFAKRGHDVALVITDLMMPIMDGVATIQVLRRLDPSVRVIAASGITANGNVARASDAGVRHFLPKPYTADTLLKIVRQVLDA